MAMLRRTAAVQGSQAARRAASQGFTISHDSAGEDWPNDADSTRQCDSIRHAPIRHRERDERCWRELSSASSISRDMGGVRGQSPGRRLADAPRDPHVLRSGCCSWPKLRPWSDYLSSQRRTRIHKGSSLSKEDRGSNSVGNSGNRHPIHFCPLCCCMFLLYLFLAAQLEYASRLNQVCRDPRWGRCYESYSENPELVTKMTDMITGLQGQPPAGYPKGVPFLAGKFNVLACAKHYVGDGGTRDGIDGNDTISSYNSLVNTHLVPYIDSIQKGVSSVMVSLSSWNGIKMHMNKQLLTDVLKKQLGFKGFVISDIQGIDSITSPPGANYTYSVLVSINAGLDMIMVPFAYTTFIDTLTLLVNGGYIPMERIDDAVSRILYVKFISGLFEAPKSDKSLQREFGAQSHRDVAREAVRKSLVLLKNGKESSSTPFLPLTKTALKILVAGSHANNLGYQCGGWTISWQGDGGNTTIGTTVLRAIESTVSKTTQVVYEESPDAASLKGSNYEYAIVVVGEPPYAETRGDNLNLTIPLGGIDTIKNVCGSVKCLVILISGRPLVIEPYVPLMDALVAAWLPGSEGQGITDVIFGDYDFYGKSSRTWFRNVDQLPMNFGDRVYDPLFPYGFGLTTGKGFLTRDVLGQPLVKTN